jgi:hypothetical protein
VAASKDELGRRRFENLVDRVEALMSGSLEPEFDGYCAVGEFGLAQSDGVYPLMRPLA